MKYEVDSYRVIQYISNLDDKVIRNVTKTIRKWNDAILNEALKTVNVDRGTLQDSITSDLLYLAGQIVGKIGTNLFYAKYVHGVWVDGEWKGPRPHFVPFMDKSGNIINPDLIKWAIRHHYATMVDGKMYKILKNGKLAKINGIFVSGKPNPFIGKAFDKYKNKIIQDFETMNLQTD